MNWEYISGFFDADGHITLSAMNKGKNKTICVGFTNIDLKLLEEIKEFIDNQISGKGTITKRTSKEEHHSTCYNLIYRYNLGLLVVENINSKHYKKSKKINLVLNDYKKVTPRNGKYTEDMIKIREKFINEFFSL
jgi:hypothetical protein